MANALRRAIRVCHFPPGTRKGNTIEQRRFSFLSQNWRGHPLDRLATVVNLIATTTTDKGLYLETSIDDMISEKGIEVSDDDFPVLHIMREKCPGEWHYVIKPQR